jgi:hypothetical protein
VSFPLSYGSFTGSADTGWSIEIWFTHFQMDYVLTLTLELLGALEHIHNYERSDFFGTFGYHNEMPKVLKVIRRSD